MSIDMFESKLTTWFGESAPTGVPAELTQRVLDATADTRQLPGWRAMLGAPVMNEWMVQ